MGVGRDKPALLSYQIPYNILDVDQSPSYGLSIIYGEDIMADLRECLSRGWAVSVPDFEGTDAAFSAGPQAGHAVIDSVRAVLYFTNLTEQSKARYVLWATPAAHSQAALQQSCRPRTHPSKTSRG
ncbi:hypothetical protein MCOR25_010411 [Pyricularia grisea]|nr:hypothetical protein MCOR25_010411 [Pyricularia grisea]